MTATPGLDTIPAEQAFRNTYYHRVARIFDTVAPAYDCPELRFFSHGAEVLSQLMPLKGDEQLLDVGTGTGEVALAIARRVRQGDVTGIDVSEAMLEKAREKAAVRGQANISFEKRDILEAGFRPGRFHGAVSGFAVSLFPDADQCVQAMTEQVRKGGFVAISTFTPDTFEPHISQAFLDAGQVGAPIPAQQDRKRFLSRTEHTQSFENAGLLQVSSTTRQLGYPLEDFDAWWRFLSNSGFRGVLLGMNSDQLQAYQKQHRLQMRRIFGDVGLNIDITVRFTIGWKH